MRFTAYLVSIFLTALYPALSYSMTTPLISWNTQEGIKRLASSKHKVDFFKLANQFESQSNKIFCGPTSAAIVLNALRVRNSTLELPEDKTLLNKEDLNHLPQNNRWSPFYKRYTQNNVLTKSPKTRRMILGEPTVGQDGKPIKDFGLQLHQLATLLKAHNVDTNTYVVDNKVNNDAIKSVMINNLKQANDYVIVNYQRKVLNQAGGGHISPIGAYDEQSDSFLILDTAPNKADWVWVKSTDLISAMRTFDTIENRGFITVKEHN